MGVLQHVCHHYNSCIVPVGFLPWEIRVAFPGESQLRQSHTTKPSVHAGCFSVSIFHRTLTRTTGSLTCAQMLMHAIAHGDVRTHLRESSPKVDWEKNPVPHWGIEPASAAWWSDALTNWATSHPEHQCLMRSAPSEILHPSLHRSLSVLFCAQLFWWFHCSVRCKLPPL